MTPAYKFFQRCFGPRWAAILTTLLYAGIVMAVVLTFGTGSENHIPYLDQ